MQKNMKRSLALILAVMLCFSGIPFSAFALESHPAGAAPSEVPPSDGEAESSQPEAAPSPEPTETPEPADEPTEQPEETPAPTPTTEPGGGDGPYEIEGASVDVTRVWPTAPRRAAALASVGAGSVLRIKLFFKWGIEFGKPYQVPDKGSRPVRYASRQALMEAIHEAYTHLRPRKSEPSTQPMEKPAKIRTERNETENV